MAKVEIEIVRTVEITREEKVVLELDVPKDILDDPDGDFGLLDWVDTQMKITGSAARNAGDAAGWDIEDEDESIEYSEANNLSE